MSKIEFYRKGNQELSREMWDASDIMAHLKCDTTTAEGLMKEYRNRHGIKGDRSIEKHLILDFINEKQRAEREREARHQSDLSNMEISATLKEQVKTLKDQVKTLREQHTELARQVEALRDQNSTLKEICRSSSEDAGKARIQSVVANVLSILSIAIAIISLVLK